MKAMLTLAICSLLGAQAATQTPDSDIRAQLRAWDQAYEGRDASALGRILTDDFTLTDASGAVLIKAEYLMSIVKAPDFSRVTSWASEDVSVNVTGDKAVVTGRSPVKGRARGKGQAMAGNYLFTDEWVRQDGVWKARRTTARAAAVK
jgi:ketosteroid isomerase-like protein